jgi:U4/U6 small nuclear ribonucleoprotein PRP31
MEGSLLPASTLTDQYLADLDDLEDASSGGGSSDDSSSNDDMSEASDMEFDEDAAAAEENVGDIRHLIKLCGSDKLKEHLERVAQLQQQAVVVGEALSIKEYDVVVKSSSMMSDLEGELLSLHKYCRDLYAPRFPELESLILNPLDYARVVQRIGNTEDLTAIQLDDILPSAQVMVVTVTATTTVGKALSSEQLQAVHRTTNSMFEVEDARKKLLLFIESRSAAIAPNLSALIGPGVAAQLIVQAGGLQSLAEMPSCNLQILGKRRRNLAGLSTTGQNVHAGFLYSCDIMLRTPPSLRSKLVKLVAGKCTLCCRVDLSKEDFGGNVGKKFRDEIQAKLQKLMEPPPIKRDKASAAFCNCFAFTIAASPHPAVQAVKRPDEKHSRRRGGKRYRKMKERYRLSHFLIRLKQHRWFYFNSFEHQQCPARCKTSRVLSDTP